MIQAKTAQNIKNDSYKEANTIDSEAIFDVERAFKDTLL